MKTIHIFAAFALLTILASCGTNLRPFTQELYDEYGWTEDELRRIQFYVSRDVVLTRQLTTGSTQIVSGEIKIVDGREVEEIIIPAGTPGVFLFSPKSNRLAVSFDDGSDERFLMFGPNPNANNRFVLLASEWDRNSGKVTYEGQSYWVESSVAYASLMVDLRKIQKTKVKSHTASGRKVN